MKWLLACTAALAAVSVAACTPAETKPGTKPEAAAEAPKGEPTPTLAPVSLVGVWTGTITCYKMASPLTVTIDGVAPEKAQIGQGDGGALKWTADVSVDSAARMVTLKGPQPTADAAVIAGPLSADMTKITGKMDKQLCTDFTLTRQP